MTDSHRARDDRPYRPGAWAKASALVTSLMWFVYLYIAAMRGADFAMGLLGMFVNALLGVLFLLVIPWVVGTIFCMAARGSRRAGDIGFTVAMIAQGIALGIVSVVVK